MAPYSSARRIVRIAAAIFTLAIASRASDGFAAERQATSVSHRVYHPRRYPHAYYPRYYGHGGYYGHYGHGGYYRGYSYGYSPRYPGYYHRPSYYPPYAYYPRAYYPLSPYLRAYVPWPAAYGLRYYGYGIYAAMSGFYGDLRRHDSQPRVGRETGDETGERPPLPRGVYAECYYW